MEAGGVREARGGGALEVGDSCREAQAHLAEVVERRLQGTTWSKEYVRSGANRRRGYERRYLPLRSHHTWWYSCDPCEKLKRATFIPAFNISQHHNFATSVGRTGQKPTVSQQLLQYGNALRFWPQSTNDLRLWGRSGRSAEDLL